MGVTRHIPTAAADQPIVAEAAFQRVVAREATDRLVLRGADQHVRPLGADDDGAPLQQARFNLVQFYRAIELDAGVDGTVAVRIDVDDGSF